MTFSAARRVPLNSELEALRTSMSDLREAVGIAMSPSHFPLPADPVHRLAYAEMLVRSIEHPDMRMAVSAHAHFARRKARELNPALELLTEQGCPPDAVDMAFAGNDRLSPGECQVGGGQCSTPPSRMPAPFAFGATHPAPQNTAGPYTATLRSLPGPVCPSEQGRAFRIRDFCGDLIGILCIAFILAAGLFFAEVYR